MSWKTIGSKRVGPKKGKRDGDSAEDSPNEVKPGATITDSADVAVDGQTFVSKNAFGAISMPDQVSPSKHRPQEDPVTNDAAPKPATPTAHQIDDPADDIVVSVKSAETKLNWAEMSEGADPEDIAFNLNKNLGYCSSMAEQMTFLSDVTTVVANALKKTIASHHARFVESRSDERSYANHLHMLIQSSRAVTNLMTSQLVDLNTIIDGHAKEKDAMLRELEEFVKKLTDAGTTPGPNGAVATSAVATNGGTATNAARGSVVQKKTSFQEIPASDSSRRVSYAATLRGDCVPSPLRMAESQSDRAVVQIAGAYDINVPTALSGEMVPPMAIRFCPKIGVFLINLDGDVYSFGNGTFVSKRNRVGETTLYGKRCSPIGGECNPAECTYYHDPLYHPNGHQTRTMAMHYIMEELVKGVATDEDVQTNMFPRNPYVVEDLIQFAGMIMLKALGVKNTLRLRRPKNRDYSAPMMPKLAPVGRDRDMVLSRDGTTYRRHGSTNHSRAGRTTTNGSGLIAGTTGDRTTGRGLEDRGASPDGR